MKKKLKKRNPIAGTLRNPCFRKQVVRNQKLYSRKGKAVRQMLSDGLFCIVVK